MALVQGYSSGSSSDDDGDNTAYNKVPVLPTHEFVSAPHVDLIPHTHDVINSDVITASKKRNFAGSFQEQYSDGASFKLQQQMSSKRLNAETLSSQKRKSKKIKKQRSSNRDDEFDISGPWSKYESSSDNNSYQHEEKTNEVENELVIINNEDNADMAKEPLLEDDFDKIIPTPKVTTNFFGSSKYDYLGRTYMHIPRDLGINLTKEVGDQECFAPKKVIHTFKGHTKGITKLEFFPKSGHLLLSAGFDGKIFLWDVYHKRDLLRGFFGHSQAVKDITFNKTGDKFLSCGFDKKIILWDTEKGKILQTISVKSIPNTIKFNPQNENEFIVGLSNHKIEHYNLQSPTFDTPIQIYDHHLGAINFLLIIDDGNRFMSTSTDKSVRFWDWQINIPIKFISDPSQHSMPFAAIYPTGKFIALQSMDNSVSVIQGHGKYKFVKNKYFTGHNVAGYGIGIDFTPDGKLLMSGDSKGFGLFWDWKTCKVISKLKVSEKTISCIKAHPQETSKVVMAGASGQIYYCD